MPQLHACQSAVAVDGFCHAGEIARVALVPATLGFHLAHGQKRVRQAMARAGAVRHLIEAVGSGDGPDFHGFEQNIKSGIAGHPHKLTGHLKM